MTGNEYQRLAARTMRITTSKGKLMEGIMGLTGEAGECADVAKKHFFQGHELNKEHMAEELSDVLWYVAEVAGAIGYSLEDIMQMNIEKLKRRYPEGFDTERSINRDWSGKE